MLRPSPAPTVFDLDLSRAYNRAADSAMSNTLQGGPPRARESAADANGLTVSAAPLVLALDTATDARSVAVARGAQALALAVEPAGASGASLVLSQIDLALSEAGVAFNELELFAVATGPGSFTGLRAGLSTVKAFAATTGRRVAGVPTLHAVAYAAGVSDCTVAAIPAGRGEVFAQILRVTQDGIAHEFSRPAHVKPALLVEQVRDFSAEARWVGGGAVAHVDLIRETAMRAGLQWRELTRPEARGPRPPGAGWSLVAPVESYALEIAGLGLASLGQGMTVDAESLRALYVRPSDAELKEKCHA